MSSPSKAQTVTAEVDESLQKLRQAMDGGNVKSIAKAAFSCPSLRDQLVQGVVKILDDECSTYVAILESRYLYFIGFQLTMSKRYRGNRLCLNYSENL